MSVSVVPQWWRCRVLLTTVTAASHCLSWLEATGWQDVAWQWGRGEVKHSRKWKEEWGRGRNDGKAGEVIGLHLFGPIRAGGGLSEGPGLLPRTPDHETTVEGAASILEPLERLQQSRGGIGKSAHT